MSLKETKTLLITEDDPAILDALEIVFTRSGYRVITYTTGSALLENNFEKPDLFLIDKQLSGVDGLDLCRHLKASAGTNKIPVIIFSASPHVQKPAIAAGADDFIEKPFSNKAVLDLVARYI
jgi:DNA-binding response OmpR family regulator